MFRPQKIYMLFGTKGLRTKVSFCCYFNNNLFFLKEIIVCQVKVSVKLISPPAVNQLDNLIAYQKINLII